MEHWWINGQPGRLLEITDRGFTYGDGLFETLAVRGGAPRFLDLHLERLFAGCDRLGIKLPPSAALTADLLLATRGLQHGVLKIIATRGPGPRGYRQPANPVTTVAWGIEETLPGRSLPIEVCWCATRLSANAATAGLKTLGRLEQVLARAEWSRPGVEEGLMLSTEGHLIGGTASNVFVVTGDRVLTPDLSQGGIGGVMRRVVLEAGKQTGLRLKEARIDPSAVLESTEIFLTNALTGIRPVSRLGAHVWPPGPITRRLQVLLVAKGVGECAAET